MNEWETCIAEWATRCHEKDATIAALQAVIRQMGEQAAVLAKDGMAAKAQVAALQAVKADAQDANRLLRRELSKLREKYDAECVMSEGLQAQLTQRTAELERVRADNKALDKWRADVTVSLQRPEGAFFVDVPQHIKDLMKERDDLRTLIAALPKVEGEIEVSSGVYNFILLKHDSGTRFLCGQIETEQTAKAYAALLQHRQGMEG